jgi:hypothetical protein
MRLSSVDVPEFTWSGTLVFVGAFSVTGWRRRGSVPGLRGAVTC